jgi:hypothetical protein
VLEGNLLHYQNDWPGTAFAPFVLIVGALILLLQITAGFMEDFKRCNR